MEEKDEVGTSHAQRRANQLSEVFERWHVGVAVLHVAHGIASERYALRGRFIGVLVAVVTGVVGTALFTTAATNAQVWLRYTAGGMSLVVAILGVLQIALNYPELAARHRAGYVYYGALRRQLEILRMRNAAGDAPTDVEVATFRESWSKVEADTPVVPGRLRNTASRAIDDGLLRQMKRRAERDRLSKSLNG